MNSTISYSWMDLVTFLIALELGFSLGFPTPVKAELAVELSGLDQPLTPVVRFTPPLDDGDPHDTASGGTRGSCTPNAQTSPQNITALLPESSGGLTLQSHPSFFVYIPAIPARSMLWTLKDENERIHYQKIVPIPETPGIISLELPINEAPIEVNKTYHWFAIALCHSDPEQPNSNSAFLYTLNDPWVQGWVRRVAPDATLSHQSKSEASLELAAMYANQGIWFDTLTTLAELQKARPQNSTFAREWTMLLDSVGLEAISTQPLLNSSNEVRSDG